MKMNLFLDPPNFVHGRSHWSDVEQEDDLRMYVVKLGLLLLYIIFQSII